MNQAALLMPVFVLILWILSVTISEVKTDKY
jgi:hypothetical protein